MGMLADSKGLKILDTQTGQCLFIDLFLQPVVHVLATGLEALVEAACAARHVTFAQMLQ